MITVKHHNLKVSEIQAIVLVPEGDCTPPTLTTRRYWKPSPTTPEAECSMVVFSVTVISVHHIGP